jgi:hypothetical protein
MARGRLYKFLEQTAPVRALVRVRGRRRQRTALAQLAAQPGSAGKPTLLVINHFFDQEIRAMRESEAFTNRFDLVILDPWTFFGENYGIFPYAVRHGGYAYDDPRLARARERSRDHARKLLDALGAQRNVCAIVTPSDIFFWLRELIAVGRERDVPTVVFDKEGTISPASFATEPDRTQRLFPPIADWFYVWSERQREFWTRAGLPPERIRVLGSLRTDLYVNLPAPPRRAILFFDFEDEAYLQGLKPEERRKYEGNWAPMRQEIHRILLEKARAWPDVPFTFKLHPQQFDRDETIAHINGLGLPNVKATAGSGTVSDIVAAHSIAFGFQTTALMEVAMTTRPSVYLAWGILHEALREQLVPLMEPGFGIHWVQNADEFSSWIDRHLRDGWVPKRLPRKRLEMFFHQPDGRVAQRHAEALEQDLRLAPAAPAARPTRARRRPP